MGAPGLAGGARLQTQPHPPHLYPPRLVTRVVRISAHLEHGKPNMLSEIPLHRKVSTIKSCLTARKHTQPLGSCLGGRARGTAGRVHEL